MSKINLAKASVVPETDETINVQIAELSPEQLQAQAETRFLELKREAYGLKDEVTGEWLPLCPELAAVATKGISIGQRTNGKYLGWHEDSARLWAHFAQGNVRQLDDGSVEIAIGQNKVAAFAIGVGGTFHGRKVSATDFVVEQSFKKLANKSNACSVKINPEMALNRL